MDSLYALLDPLVIPLQWLLELIHSFGVSWAWSIVVLTVIVRTAMIPLTVKQQQSFRAMQALQPEIKKLQQKYKNDRQKLNEEMMAFYKENKVNPFGSCLPLLVQLPIFFALYVLLSDIADEVASTDDLSMFWGWIPDITEGLDTLAGSVLWPLMIVYVLSQMGSTLLMPTSVDPKQKYIFLFLPIVFAYFIVSPPFGATVFPVGLLIYWITTNLWTCGQAAVIRIWFPPPVPPSVLERQEKERAKKEQARAQGQSVGLAARLGLGGGSGAKQKQKAKAKPKPKDKVPKADPAEAVEAPGAAAETTSGEGSAASAEPAPRSKAARRKRPAKPPKQGPKDPA